MTGRRDQPLGHRYHRPEVEVSIAPFGLPGTLVYPAGGQGLVLFAHGSGSSRLSPRNRLVAERLQRSGLGTLLFDLLQTEEASNRRNVFDIGLLAERLALATDWVRSAGGVTLTTNTDLHLSSENRMPSEINDLGCAKTGLVGRLDGYSQLT